MNEQYSNKKVIAAQPGPQERFLSCAADIALFGGSKGGGKSMGLRLDAVRHVSRAGYHAVIFRRTRSQIKAAGGLWDKSFDIYPYLGGRPNLTELSWKFTVGSTIAFTHLQHEKDKLNWQGTEVTYFGFDQLEEFSKSQFIFIMGCLRSLCGIKPVIRATLNPEVNWVRELVDPWIASDGYADLNKVGKVKYLTIEDDKFVWVDKNWRDINGNPAKTITFINADVWDNPELLKRNPEYLSNLYAQSYVDRQRFLGIKGRGGNWDVKPTAGLMFNSGWFEFVEVKQVPSYGELIRFWDFAGSTRKKSKFTAGVLMLKWQQDYYILDVINRQVSSAGIDELVEVTARRDGRAKVRWEQEPGQSGMYQSAKLVDLLRGYDAAGAATTVDKISRANPFSAAAEHGSVKLLRAPWNNDFLNQLEQFPDGELKDMVDAAVWAYNLLSGEFKAAFGQGKYRV